MISDRVIAEARRVNGQCACTPFRDAFRAWLGPVANGGAWQLDKPFRQWQDPPGLLHTEGVSTCALATERIWLGVGIAIPPGWYPYAGGTFVRTHVWAAQHHALGDLRLLPTDGAAIWTASHFIACVTDWFDPWSTELDYQDCHTVEGGATCLLTTGGHEGRGLQALHEHHRRYWPNTGGGAWLADVRGDGSVGPKSKVLGWIDVDKLPEAR